MVEIDVQNKRKRIEKEINQKVIPISQNEKFHFLKDLYKKFLNRKLIADIGSGAGGFTIQAASEGADVIALDISGVALSMTKKNMQSFNVSYKFDAILEDACNLPLREGITDVVVLLDTLEHIPKPDKALTEANRVLIKEDLCF